MEDEENNTAREESTKKMEEASDVMDEETATKKTEGEENGTEKEETTKKMEEGGDLIDEETTTKKMGETNDPTEEDTATKTTEDDENDPKEEETANKMEEERNTKTKMEAESEPSMVNAISQKEKIKGTMIEKDKRKPPRIRKSRKFKRMQVGSSSTHPPSSDEVIQEQRPVKIHEKQESSKLDEEIGMVMLSLSESNVPQPERIEGTGVTDLRESKLPQLEVDRDERRAEDGPRRWRPPEKGWLKMNVEGLISENKMATGAVIRDSDGSFLAAISGTFDSVMHIDTAKLIAVRNALLWAEAGGRMDHNYLVELDSEQVVQHLLDFASVYWLLPDDLRDIVADCLTIRMHFPRMQFACVSAGENRVAHCLASRALHHGCEGEWYEFDPPDWLQEAILEDLPQLEVDREERRAEDGPRRWRPPEKGWLKMNVEGLISEHLIATSVVIRNCNGIFLAAISGTFDLVTHVDTVKLLALRNALLWVKNGGGGKYDYLVELNSEQVVKHLRDFACVYRMLPDESMEILDECFELETHFQRMQFANVSAEENRVAHCLASRALHQGCEGEWFALDAPDWLQEAILEDLPNIR